MKQYTTPEQTAKLIELGFDRPKPKWELDEKGDYRAKVPEANYSIGELIEMLPDFINIWNLTDFKANKKVWNVGYVFSPTICRPELIDALYDMIVKLKEDGRDENED